MFSAQTTGNLGGSSSRDIVFRFIVLLFPSLRNTAGAGGSDSSILFRALGSGWPQLGRHHSSRVVCVGGRTDDAVSLKQRLLWQVFGRV